jgi:hypothetical protein
MSSQSPGAVLYDLNGVPLVGPAGTPSASVLTIQGITGGTSVLVSGTGTAGSPGTAVLTIQGITNGTPISITEADVTAGPTALGSLNAAISIAVAGETNAGLMLAAGTLVGTIVPEVSLDGGTTWVATFFDDPVTGNIVSSIVFGSSNTVTTRSIVSVGGASNMRVRVSAYTSGTANASLRASTMEDQTVLFGGAAGSILPPVVAQIGGSVTTSPPSYGNATLNALSLTTVGNLRVDGSTVTQPVVGTGTAGAPGTAVLTIQGIGSGTPIPVSGTVTATNASVSATGSAVPASATYVGALVTTAAESGLSNNDMYALNMTTTGQLRIDGVYPEATAAATAVDMANVGGQVTTSAPSYSTATVNALSLTTVGNLRVDGSSVTQPVSGSVTANAGTGNFTVVQATASNLNAAVVGVGTAGTPSGGVLTVQGNSSGTPIPISGTFTTDKSTTGTITSVAGSVTSVTLLSSNTSRVSATFTNDSASQVYIALASTSSTTAYTIKVLPNDYWELPVAYTGIISGIWTSATGNMRITELT